ncbi:Ku protein [Pseudomonas antarctica]|uniref:Ku protein n=1 Tax=Pseudomonas antarctica TaxID=219572 RepID=A0A1H0ADB1_9PSED|nr:hypothetical protein PSAN_41340 [Pseudomonas antarctica]SDN30706.1 Ku protein [Pseudomonas antarctica]
MPRAIWKGAISFGLVHIPVSLVSATTAHGVDFDWLDTRSTDPVGDKRINKTTGKEVTKETVVKGVALEKGRYGVPSEDEIRSAHPKSTRGPVMPIGRRSVRRCRASWARSHHRDSRPRMF